MGPPSDKTAAGLGEFDTWLERWVQWLPEYAKKSWSRGGSWRARARNAKKTLKNGDFWTLGPILGGFPDWVRAIDLGGDPSILGQPEYGKKNPSRDQPRGLRAPKPSKMVIFEVFLDFWGPKWPGLGLKTSEMDSARPRTPI